MSEEGLASFIKKSMSFAARKSRWFVDRNILRYPRRYLFARKYCRPIDVMEQDWDYLVILDACRYDIFSEVAEIDGTLDWVISKGSHSVEFCNAHFDGRTYNDAVYVTANGYGAKIGESTFHDLIFTDEFDSVPDVEVLHSTKEGLAPNMVYNTAIDASRKYENKRLIIHFMQPHMPYFGKRAEELRERVENDGLYILSRDKANMEEYGDLENVESGLDGAFRRGYITQDELREVYIENLERALQYVEKLIEELNGKIAITSDHGEYLGEYGRAGHYKYEFTEELRKVPWLVVNGETRPRIVEEEPTNKVSVDKNAVEERLRVLGYKN